MSHGAWGQPDARCQLATERESTACHGSEGQIDASTCACGSLKAGRSLHSHHTQRCARMRLGRCCAGRRRWNPSRRLVTYARGMPAIQLPYRASQRGARPLHCRVCTAVCGGAARVGAAASAAGCMRPVGLPWSGGGNCEHARNAGGEKMRRHWPCLRRGQRSAREQQAESISQRPPGVASAVARRLRASVCPGVATSGSRPALRALETCCR